MLKYIIRYNIFELIKIFFFELIHVGRKFNFNYIKSNNLKYFDHLPTPYYYLHKIYSEIKSYKKKKFFFLDLGCGTGRVVNFFFNKGFVNIVGIEQSKKIYKLCLNQIISSRIKIYNIDFVDYKIPKSNGIIYLYNPGPLNLIKKLIKKLIRGNYKNVLIIYVKPVFLNSFKDNFKIVKKDCDAKFRGYVILKLINNS